MAATTATKSVKKASAPKKAAAKSAPSHPPYIEMITEALVSLKERTGSSHYAIAKHIEEQQKVRDLPPNFKKLLFNQLKKSVASGKLVMVKKSFKLPPAASKKSPTAAPEKTKAAAKPKSKEAAEKKPAKKTTIAAKPKAAAAKTKAAAAKPKASAKSPVKKQKVAVKAAKSPAKKVAPVKAKKPKSIKSPAKKATAVKKTVSMKKTTKK